MYEENILLHKASVLLRELTESLVFLRPMIAAVLLSLVQLKVVVWRRGD